MGSQETRPEHGMRKIDITVRPKSRFPVPLSDGYSVYSALLNGLSGADETVGAHVHDTEFGSLHNSGLQGSFGDNDRPHHKTALPKETYQLSLGVVDPADREIFQALVDALVLSGDSLELTHGTLRVEHFESENASHEEVLERAGDLNDPLMEIRFRTATCIEEAGDVTTAFPYRWAVFNSLLGKWNQSCPEKLELDLTREAVLGSVIEKPDVRSLDTHSVLVNRVENDDGKTRNIFRQGFSGTCVYGFKDASESVENAVTTLAMFGEYSGVGSAVARGCGDVIVEVDEE